MNRLRLLVSDTRLRLEKSAQSVEKCVNFDEAEFVFDATWDGFDKLAVFWRGDEAYQIPLVDTNVCLIPWELMQTKGTIQIGCVGTKPDGTIVTTKTPVAQAIAAGAYRDGIAPKEPTPSIYAQLSGIVSDYVKLVDEVYAAYKNGELGSGGGSGGVGGYYTPSVEQVTEETVKYSFARSEDTLPEVAEVVLTLPRGRDGVDGKDGADGKNGVDGKNGMNGTNGKDGIDGATFTPLVAADGTLSWTNNKGLPNPSAVNIKGTTGTQGQQGIQGEKGDTGVRGSKILKVTTAPSSYTTAVGGFTPTYRIALSTVQTQANATEVLPYDMLAYSYYHYPVGYVDSSYVYCGARQSIRGSNGSTGEAGADGYTPVKGTDYFTDADKEEIVDMATENVKGYVNEVSTGFASKNKVETLERSVAAIVEAHEETYDTVYDHTHDKKNPHAVTAAQIGAPTIAQMNEAIAGASIGGGGGGSGGGGASSWDELGHGIGMGTILEETTLTSTSTQLNEVIGLIVGNTYTVNWNGVEYTPTANDASALAGVDGAVLLGMSAKYPFTILAKPGVGTSISVDSGSPPVTVSITGVGYVTLPIPGKYLPKGTPWIEEGIFALLEETEADTFTHPDFGDMWMISGKTVNLKVGETYTIHYNGADYNCVCQAAPEGLIDDPNAVAMGNFYVVGGPNTGEPFAMLASATFAEIDIIDLTGASGVTVSIIGQGEKAHKLDPSCLPENSGIVYVTAMPKGLSSTNVDVDKTMAEINALVESGRQVVMKYLYMGIVPILMPLAGYAVGQMFMFSCTTMVSTGQADFFNGRIDANGANVWHHVAEVTRANYD